ncbi:EAL domain-containing protein [Ramlibacter sp. MAHUQ-53]|uniref:EAL domain-containing protein n=1 Tax=unclassified Ramlibacter TaxID=2617605 RepID=UPI0036316B15
MTARASPAPRNFRAWMPQSLASRVFLLYGLSILIAALGALGLITYQQFTQHIEDNQQSVVKLAEVSMQPITESALIGDFDTIQRLLDRIVTSSPLREAVYSDKAGGRIRAEDRALPRAPAWLTGLVAERMPDLRREVSVGGRNYGVLELRFNARQIAGDLWALSLQTAALIFFGLGAGLLVMRLALRRWLQNLDRLHVYEEQVLAGAIDAQAALSDDAPLEIRRAVDVINRTAGSLRAQFGQRIDSLMHALIQHKKAMDEATIVCELDPEGRLVYANDRFVAAVGLPRAALLGQRLQDAEGRDWQPSGSTWHGEVAVVDAMSRRRWHRRSIVPIFGADHLQVEKYICIDIDVTVQKTSERELIDQVRRQNMITTFGQKALGGDDVSGLQQLALELVCSGLHVDHAALLVQGPNDPAPRVEAGMGWEEGWVGVPAALEGDPPRLAPPPRLLEAHGVRGLLVQQGEADASSGLRFALVAATPQPRAFRNADRDFLRSLVHVLSAARERHHTREHLTYLAQFDALTGLPNRRLLLERLDLALEAAPAQDTRLCLMYLDLDHFKLVNDTLGHEAGDLLLVQAAHRMVSCLRAGDTVARLSGDEFAVLLTGLQSPGDAERVARKLISQLGQPFDLDGREAFISASVGAALSPDHGVEAATLVRRADRAMYAAKAAGRNAFEFFTEEMSAQASDRLAVQTQLRAALEREEFFLEYQPKVDLSTGGICGFEALLRWRHPARGLVSPAEFIPVLEDTGMILGVGEWVMRAVARQILDWQAQGLKVPRVAVNLSARQFSSGELDGQVRAVLADTGIDPSLLEFELTESMLMRDPAQSTEQLQRFRGYGLRLSVDDFGTGYSSLSYLSRFPLDALKVDRAFVSDLATNPDDAAIARAVIGLAHSLQLKVVAEGVETTEQLDILARRGCDEIQGFYFSRPVAPEACAAMMREGRRLHRQADGSWRVEAVRATA